MFGPRNIYVVSMGSIFFIFIIISTMIDQCVYNDYNVWCFSTLLGLKVCEEYNNSHYSRSIFMVNELKFSPNSFWVLVYYQYSSYFCLFTGWLLIKESLYQLDDVRCHNTDGKTQSLCCLVLIMRTKFIAVMRYVLCFV